MKKSEKIIDMEQRGGVFVPAKISQEKAAFRSIRRNRGISPLSQPLQIGKILEKMVVDLFRSVRREMFR